MVLAAPHPTDVRAWLPGLHGGCSMGHQCRHVTGAWRYLLAPGWGWLATLLFGCAGGLPVASGGGHAGADAQPAWEATTVQRESDRVTAALRDQVLDVTVVSPGGIGSARLLRRSGAWPRNLRIRFLYTADRPFTRLEGFTAAVHGRTSAVLRKQELTVTSGAEGVVLVLPFPADADPTAEVHLTWVDAYR